MQAAKINFRLNDVHNIVDLCHTSEVYVGNDRFPLADVTVANILPGMKNSLTLLIFSICLICCNLFVVGALTRLVVPLWGLTKPGGTLCLSGMRPSDLAAVRAKFLPFISTDGEDTQITSSDLFGDWIRWTVKTKVLSKEEKSKLIHSLAELSVE